MQIKFIHFFAKSSCMHRHCIGIGLPLILLQKKG